MEVLSFSEVQYVSDSNCSQRSPGTKSPLETDDGYGLTKAGFSQEKTLGDEQSFGICKEDQAEMELDCTLDRPNDTYAEGDPWPEVDSSSQSLQNVLMDGVNLQLGRCNNLGGDNVSNIVHERGETFDLTNSSKKMECNVANGNHHEKDMINADEGGDQGKLIELLPLKFPRRGNTTYTEQRISTSVTVKKSDEHTPDGKELPEGEKAEDEKMVDVGHTCESGRIYDSAVVPKLVEKLSSYSTGPFRDLEQGVCDGNATVEHELMHKGESKLPNGTQVAETELLNQDETVALWVKCRGKWEAGIRCSRADWPLSTLKSKPTHGRKKYCVVFFPNTRTHSWADMLLVRPIDESPEPLAYGNHYSCLESVKDLTSPRRYTMQKLTVEMLNVTDQLHAGAVTEMARQATAWKEFAMQAYHCEGYSDLGKMLLKLQSMILPGFIDPYWLQDSFNHWAHLSRNAQTAESVETLTKELVDSVLWDQVEALWDAPIQPDSGPEWKTWKQEVMKWFSTSHPPVAVTETSLEQHNFDDSSASISPQISRKRQKLEIRRADTQASQVEAETCQVDIDSGFFSCVPAGNLVAAVEAHKEEQFADYPNNGGDGWVEIVVEAGNPDFTRNASEPGPSVEAEPTSKSLVEVQHGSHSGNKYRQCMAFVAAKGRQCGRWANDGDIYCCVHLNCHYAEKAANVEQTPPAYSNAMCEGTTNHGERCKHRARFGSLYCKKHRPQGSEVGSGDMLFSPDNNLKRKLSETNGSLENIQSEDLITGKEIILLGGKNIFQDNLHLVSEGVTTEERKNPAVELTVKCEASPSNDLEGQNEEWSCCIVWCHENNSQCLERAKLHTLYCEKHRPNFLKRARNGKSRLISKEHFLDLLKNCGSKNKKVQLHQACELLYGFLKSALNRRNRVSKDQLMEWILTETSKDFGVGECLVELVALEKEKIGRLWGFNTEKGSKVSVTGSQSIVHLAEGQDKVCIVSTAMKCKICTDEFFDDQALGAHWMDVHKKEAQWLFRGYACAICMNSFTNRKVLEAHAKEKHNVQSLDQCILFQCMPCGNHFEDPEQLWVHVLSFHSMDFRLRTSSEHYNQASSFVAASRPLPAAGNGLRTTNDGTVTRDETLDVPRKFVCRFCGLKFDLLPDLGRHHQAAHMGPNATSHFPPKRQAHFNSSLRRPGRPSSSKFRRDLGGAAQGTNNTDMSIRQFTDLDPMASSGLRLLTQVSEAAALERSIESQCSSVAEILFKEIQQTKHRPSNLEILSVAQLSCCKVGLQSALEEKFGPMSDRLYLKAAKFCSELNIRVEWHQEGFICPRGCQQQSRVPDISSCLSPLPAVLVESPVEQLIKCTGEGDVPEMEESHSIVSLLHLQQRPQQKATVLCKDISFGRERVPVPCLLDEELKNSVELQGENLYMPWKSFTYITDRLLDSSLGLDTKSSQLGCACPRPTCCPETCDHVYLFDNDYESAKDIHGKPMHGKFPYDDRGHIILEEGYLVYECNSTCSCDNSCHNRVLQNGVQVRLEIYKTEKKGWAVRAGETIPRGTFVCEYIGEVVNDHEPDKKGKRYDEVGGCCYFYDIDAHIDDMVRMNEGSVSYVIDATKYGNVSRFINHSCSPNLVNYQVLVESMDCQLAHIGLYASRDIAKGEELAYDYRYKLLPGEGCPCHCGASNCRGRLY